MKRLAATIASVFLVTSPSAQAQQPNIEAVSGGCQEGRTRP
jgi:hypothetical protein